MKTQRLMTSLDVTTARARFMDGLYGWIARCIQRYADAQPTDVHDQATYTTSWATYVQATQDTHVLSFMKKVRDDVQTHFVRTNQWHHGYWMMQEAHHGTEHYELFLGTLFQLDPEDAETKRQVLDAVEHIGNWVDAIPPWFDVDTGLFRSMYLGTHGARTESGMALNIPDHLRYINLCLLAWQMGGGERYLDFAANYVTKWATAILNRDLLPIGLLPNGPIYEFEGDTEKAYRGFVGMVGYLDDNVDRAENILASNGIGTLLSLWQATDALVFRQAAERLLDILVTQLPDPDAGAAADVVRTYRCVTGDRRYDQAILEVVAGLTPYAIQTIGMDASVKRERRPRGIGKRADMPVWFEDGEPRRHNPILLAVAAEINEDDALMTRALDLAHTYFQLACEVLPDGRHHGCAANTISAIARGHGRENGAGMVTAVLGK